MNEFRLRDYERYALQKKKMKLYHKKNGEEDFEVTWCYHLTQGYIYFLASLGPSGLTYSK